MGKTSGSQSTAYRVKRMFNCKILLPYQFAEMLRSNLLTEVHCFNGTILQFQRSTRLTQRRFYRNILIPLSHHLLYSKTWTPPHRLNANKRHISLSALVKACNHTGTLTFQGLSCIPNEGAGSYHAKAMTILDSLKLN